MLESPWLCRCLNRLEPRLPPGQRLLAEYQLRPGGEKEIPLPRQPEGVLAIYALFSDPHAEWKLLVGPAPLERRITIEVGERAMRVVP